MTDSQDGSLSGNSGKSGRPWNRNRLFNTFGTRMGAAEKRKGERAVEKKRDPGKGRKPAVGAVVCAVMFCVIAGSCGLAKEDMFCLGLPSAEWAEDMQDGNEAYEDGGLAAQNPKRQEGVLQEQDKEGQERRDQELRDSAEKVGENYFDIYEEASAQNVLMSLDVMERMVQRLGESGYAAVDSDNQVDMAGTDQVLEFCRQVSAGEEGSLTIVELSYLGGFTKYDMETAGEKVNIVRSCWQFSEEGLENKSILRYQADFWEYTQEGYLIFEGSSFAQDYYLLSMSGTPLHTALRVLPLEERYRELNRRYVAPIGYGRNNLFLLDWSEDDYGEIDFYDLFDVFYGLKYNRYVPYTAGDTAGTGAVYEVPASEFETVLMTYLDIDSKTLRSKTKYISDSDCYEYRPRGFFDAECPEIPYPEVVDCRENGDGTLTLTVNAVYPERNLSKAYVHEVVIRPLADGGVQYVSNKSLFSEEEEGGWWHVARLTEEEWKRAYGED